MSGPFSYTFYIPVLQMVEFSILNETLPAPQSQKYIKKQYTGQLQSTPDSSTALGLGTESSIYTSITDQQGQINDIMEFFWNFNGEANGETGGDIPPKGVLAVVMSTLNDMWIVPPGQHIRILKGLINPLNCSGAYFGAVGTCSLTYYPDIAIPQTIVVTYTLPPL